MYTWAVMKVKGYLQRPHIMWKYNSTEVQTFIPGCLPILCDPEAEFQELYTKVGGSVVENPPAYAGGAGSIPDPGRSHMPKSN